MCQWLSVESKWLSCQPVHLFYTFIFTSKFILTYNTNMSSKPFIQAFYANFTGRGKKERNPPPHKTAKWICHFTTKFFGAVWFFLSYHTITWHVLHPQFAENHTFLPKNTYMWIIPLANIWFVIYHLITYHMHYQPSHQQGITYSTIFNYSLFTTSRLHPVHIISIPLSHHCGSCDKLKVLKSFKTTRNYSPTNKI
jgi:hypothetical protein